jgi:hypothetical protein
MSSCSTCRWRRNMSPPARRGWPGRGVNEQRYGIALRKGSDELREQFNTALATLQGRRDDGAPGRAIPGHPRRRIGAGHGRGGSGG